MSLVEKLRKAREQQVEVGGFTFTVRRPTDVEAVALRGDTKLSDMLAFVVGWEGVKEIDLIPGGGPSAVNFSREVAAEWLADRPDLLQPLVDAIVGLYRRHVEALEAATKN